MIPDDQLAKCGVTMSMTQFLSYFTTLGVALAVTLWPIIGLKYATLSLVGWLGSLFVVGIFSSFCKFVRVKSNDTHQALTATLVGTAPAMAILSGYTALVSDCGTNDLGPVYFLIVNFALAVIAFVLSLIAIRMDRHHKTN